MNSLQELYQHLLAMNVSGLNVKHLAISMQITENLMAAERQKDQTEEAEENG